MEGFESKVQGLGWEVSPTGSKWLADNLKEMDQSVKRMLKLIEEDGLETNDEATCQRKPELIANVEGFHQLYRLLAERYDHMARELCKSVGTVGSGYSEPGYDQDSPDVKVQLNKSGNQPDGLDMSPGSPGADSVFSLKEGSESASLSSASDSDSESFVTSYLRTPLSINSQSLHQRMTELEAELSAAKDKLLTSEADLEIEKQRASELQGQIVELEARVSESESKSRVLAEELGAARILLVGSEEEIVKLKNQLEVACEELGAARISLVGSEEEIAKLKNQLEVAWEERATFETQLGSEKELVLELEEMIARYNADLSDRDIEVWELKVSQRDAEEQFLQEKAQLRSDSLSLSEKQAQLEIKLNEWESRATISEAEKAEIEAELGAQRELVDTLVAERDSMIAKLDGLEASLSVRDDHIREMERYVSELRERHDELIGQYEKARGLIEDLESEVERQRAVISDGYEEKREAIRQLCFSVDHYRSVYQELRRAFVGNRRNVVMV